MIGGIYSRVRCPDCGRKYRHFENDGVYCPDHPARRAVRLEVRCRGVSKWFRDYDSAYEFLTGLRSDIQRGRFDLRDYQRDEPLGFSTLMRRWLATKERERKASYVDHLRLYGGMAMRCWGNRNIKELGYGELEDFLLGLEGASKTRKNVRDALHSFWRWASRRTGIAVPDFPAVTYTMARRKIVSKETQQAILDEVARIAPDPKIALGLRWLATYYHVRPGELAAIREGDIDLGTRTILIPAPKEREPKVIPLLPEDVELLRGMQRALPALRFFRHPRRPGVCENAPYSRHLWNDWWLRACRNLGVQGVSCYPGTRHSTAMALRSTRTPEEIRRGSGHATNRAFDRYFELQLDDQRALYAEARRGKVVEFGPAKDLPKPFEPAKEQKTQ